MVLIQKKKKKKKKKKEEDLNGLGLGAFGPTRKREILLQFQRNGPNEKNLGHTIFLNKWASKQLKMKS